MNARGPTSRYYGCCTRCTTVNEFREIKSVSFIIATHNRQSVTLRTLEQLSNSGLDRDDYEIIVVDNASTDGTPEAVSPLCNRLISLRHNAGSCAKAYGVAQAKGAFIVFLDDDSYPHPGSIERMLEHFKADAKLGAAGFVVHLPDGRLEGGALPDVFLGCGVGFRAEALRGCGGLDDSFFMQAEEYDLSFRMAQAGWRVSMFDDLHVAHLKTPDARKSERTTFYDIRNNLRVAARFLPGDCYKAYRTDWLQRYRWLAQRDGHLASYQRGVRSGRWLAARERWTHRRHRLSPAVFEQFFRWEEISRNMQQLANSGVGCVVLADLGKNVYAYVRAAENAGVSILAIGDDRFAAPGRHYRGLEIIPLEDALASPADAVIVGNTSPVHGTATYLRVSDLTSQPVYHWFNTEPRHRKQEFDDSSPPESSDKTSAELPLTTPG